MTEIGLFQLENLTLSRARFCLVNLRRDGAIPVELGSLLQSAVAVTADQLEARVETLASAKDFPIVLVCENGQASSAAADRLERRGYSNVYVVEGGTVGLLGEL